VRAYEASQAGRLDALYDEICIDEERLRRGLVEGSLEIDTRLRDAFLTLPAAPPFPPRDVAEEVGYAVDGAVLQAGELVRLQRRVDELRMRLGTTSRRP
jgi:hypothetical protein